MRLAKLAIATLTFSALALAADPFVGRWKLIPEKSTAQGVPMTKSATVVYEEQSGGVKMSYESIEADGKPHKDTWMMVFDRKDRPYDDPDRTCDTRWARRLDAQNIEAGCKGNGKEIVGVTVALSKSGDEFTMTQFSKVPEMQMKQVFVFQKQR